MRRPDWWNWPPFMTVVRHNREITALAEGMKRQVHDWAREANYNMFTADRGFGESPVLRSRALAAFQQADELFGPERTDVKEAVHATKTVAR